MNRGNIMENILAALPFWSELSENEKTLVRSSAVIRKYSAGDLIHTCIKQCVGLVYVISGNMRLSLLTEEGKEVTLLHIEKNKMCVLAASCVICAAASLVPKEKAHPSV